MESGFAIRCKASAAGRSRAACHSALARTGRCLALGHGMGSVGTMAVEERLGDDRTSRKLKFRLSEPKCHVDAVTFCPALRSKEESTAPVGRRRHLHQLNRKRTLPCNPVIRSSPSP
jgi:hypothetical protein